MFAKETTNVANDGDNVLELSDDNKNISSDNIIIDTVVDLRIVILDEPLFYVSSGSATPTFLIFGQGPRVWADEQTTDPLK